MEDFDFTFTDETHDCVEKSDGTRVCVGDVVYSLRGGGSWVKMRVVRIEAKNEDFYNGRKIRVVGESLDSYRATSNTRGYESAPLSSVTTDEMSRGY